MEKVDDKHNGIIFTPSGDDDKIKASFKIKKRKDDFRRAIEL